MVSFQVPVGSEIINLLNFIWSDITLIAAVMLLSAKIAGRINSKRITTGERMNLKPFDVPHIGGGMVMSHGWERTLIALLRLSAIFSVCASNFGLQGRSETSLTPELSVLRVPGSVENLDIPLLFNVTEIRMRCAQLRGDQLFLGSVIDNQCYLDLHEHVFVRTLSIRFENLTREIVYRNCKSEVFRNRFYTILRCGEIDLSCDGPHRNSDQIDVRLCPAVVYDGDQSWYCPAIGFDPTFQGNQTVACRMIGAKKKDIEYWTDLYRVKTADPLVAIFGSAYAQERTVEVEVPGEESSVTIFTLWWIIPAIWQVVLVAGLLIWFVWLRRRGSKTYGNDERNLLVLLREASDAIHDVTDGSERIDGV